jgi:hypothetical protein
MVEGSDVSLLPNAPVRPEEEHSEVSQGVGASRPNGALHAKTAPRVAMNGRTARRAAQPKGSIFDSLWPKTQRAAPEAQTALAAEAPPPPAEPAPVPAQPAVSAEPAPQLQPAAPRQEGAAAISILKSGVVEGMAYTLYSDGSIEAQLPQGTLRFGSITELRNHIEQNS